VIEGSIIIAILGTVVFLGARSVYRIFSGRTDGCACGTKSCPSSGTCITANRQVGQGVGGLSSADRIMEEEP